MNVNYTEGFSTMTIGGKGKLYWFMFKRMDKIWSVLAILLLLYFANFL